jgi:hypothetical protein
MDEEDRALTRIPGARRPTVGARGLPVASFPIKLSLSRAARRRLALFLVLLFSRPGADLVSAAQHVAASGDEALALFPPARREADAPPEGPPDLPPGAERVTPVTVQAVIHRQLFTGEARTLRQTVHRTVDRVYVESSAGREWLFERNVRDPRRVFGWAIDHTARVIVVYDESDLRAALGLRGWFGVFTMGFDPGSLADMKASGRTRSLERIAFAHYTAGREDAALREVWWSDDQILPSEFVTADASGSTRFSLESVRIGVDAALLEAPPTRFPTYRVFELADWLERH